MSTGTRRSKGWVRASALALLLAGGCASYRPLPLPERPDLLDQVPSLEVPARTLGLPAVAGRPFEPRDGLDMTEVAVLAAVHNPALRAARLQVGVARAQLFAAGLLPDPQLSLAGDTVTGGPGTTQAYNLGLNYGLTEILTRSSRMDATQHDEERVSLEILWQEWQVVQQARALFVQAVSQDRKLDLTRRVRELYAERYARSSQALREGNVTLDVAGTDLTALLGAESQVYQLESAQAKTRSELSSLLGLSPAAHLSLGQPGQAPALPDAGYRQALQSLPTRRPDLLALRAGYGSQEAKVRTAILEQFPSVNIGIVRARDTSDVRTLGLGITLTLPLVNRNRANIALERATRARLRQEYQARLDQAQGELDLLRRQQRLARRQRGRVAATLPELARMVEKARQAYDAGNLDALTYLNMEDTLLKQKLEVADLDEALWSAHIAEDTLLAWPEDPRRPQDSEPGQ
jgi:outer membrane protein TolC